MALKLLLADESITIKKVFRKAFSDDNFELAWLERDDKVLDVVKKIQPDFVILADNFPGVDLNHDIRQIANFSSQPHSVILLGNRGNALDLDKSIQLGAAGFIYKPLDNRLLKKTIDDLLHHGSQAPATPVDVSKTAAELTPSALISRIPVPGEPSETVDQRARILFDIFESYFNENMVVLTESLTKSLAPRVATDIASRIIEHLAVKDLPKQIMHMTKGIVNDLVPQIAERVISREIENIKAEAIRLLEEEDEDEENV